MPLIASDRTVSETGAQPKPKIHRSKRNTGAAGSRDLHLCVSSSNVKSEFARSPTRVESILFVDPPLLTRTHCMYARVCALLTRNIDRQPSSVTRDPTVASSFESSMLRLVYPRRGTVDDPMTPKATRRFPSPTFLHVSRIVFVSDSSNPRSSSPRFLSSRK